MASSKCKFCGETLQLTVPGRHVCKTVLLREALSVMFFDRNFVASLKKDDAIDVEFKVIEEQKQIGNGIE